MSFARLTSFSRLPSRRRGLAALSVGLVMSLGLAACGGGDDTEESSDEPTDETGTAGVTTLNGEWPLTGESLDGELPDHPVYAVKIDNTSSSDPQVGLSSADMVVEELVEGGSTRLAVLYHSDIPKEVGPVRSMRASDIGIVKPVKANLVASGGAGPTVKRLKGSNVPTLTEGDQGFFRQDGRSAPYDLFMKLGAVADKPGEKWEPPADSYLPFGEESDFEGTVPVKSMKATFSAGHTTAWKYTDDGWTRPGSYADQGDEFVPDNVLMLKVKVGSAGYKDPAGNPVPETDFFGKGEGVLVHGDQGLPIKWAKETKADKLKLTTQDGQDVEVPAGTTWIELVPSDTGKVTLSKK